MLTRHWMYSVGSAGLLTLLAMFLTSCQDRLVTNVNRELALCGRTSDNVVRVYQVAVSVAKAVTIKQTIDLPVGASCPAWLAGSKLGWLYGSFTDGYQRDMYMVDLNRRQFKKWFHLSGDDDIEDVILLSGSPWALIISNRDQAGGCSQYNSVERHWGCVHSGGDLYTVDEQGKMSHLIHSQPPLCEVKWRSGGRTVAFSHSNGCIGPAPLEGSDLLLVDTETNQIQSFGDKQGAAPAWSPDGRYLAFMKGDESLQGTLGARPFIFDLDKSKTITVDNNLENWDLGKLVWSLDSRYLAWITIQGNMEVRVFDRVGQISKIFQGGKYSSSFLQWSPDGKNLAWKDDLAFYFGNIENSSVYSVPIGVDNVPDWSFDGQDIVYIGSVNSRGPNQVFVMGKDGKDAISVTNSLSLKDIRWMQVQWVK